MTKLIANNFRLRKSYSKIKRIIDIPDLIEIQKRSYETFLQKDIPPSQRQNTGLEGVFRSVFPISDFNNTSSLEFVKYSIEKPKYDEIECRDRGMTYAAPVRVVIRLVVWDTNEQTGERSIRDIKEQDIYFGEIPLMTENGTFIINGIERVVVSQLHRSPGIFFDHDKSKSLVTGMVLYSARVIPYRGSWLDFEFDHKDILYVRIDRKRKFPVTILLKALGFTEEFLLNYYYKSEHIRFDGKKIIKSVDPDVLAGQIASYDLRHPKTKELLIKKGKKFTKYSMKKIEKAEIKEIEVNLENLIGEYASYDIVNPRTGEIILECNHPMTEEAWSEIKGCGINEFDLIFIDNVNISAALRETLLIDRISSTDESVLEIYKKMRPGDPPSQDMANNFFHNMFFNPERYDLSKVGRLKINHKFNYNVPLDHTILRKEDVLDVIRYMLDLKNGKVDVDDIDHLGNRRIKSVGELVENQYRVGLVRMERAIKERMSLQEIDSLMPHELVNPKPVSAVLREFFGSSQLSQFMDQTNPIAEITHKRRLSALGPGGMTRERAGFEVRDVHTTHYGRICPVETPEGPNIGLISSLSTYARVNDYGFVETPYRKVADGRVTNEVSYLSALEEERHVIAQANAAIDKNGMLLDEHVSSRKKGEFVLARKEEVDLMDVSPNQLVSVAASLIPFLENDDANRALMGSNMQRQAVPLLKTSTPIIGTGIEGRVAKDSGVTVSAKRGGVIESVDASRIVIKVKDSGKETGSEIDIYNLVKYRKSNQNTCINQKPIVEKGDVIEKGEVIADGPATEMGELALGQNVLVALMPWGGYNFEDSILVSETLVKEDRFTSIHIEEFECVARDTKLGKEELTRDIPNVGEEALLDLDESGIIRIGAEVMPGDILVGKITPKGETQLSPEEKLLRAIFGEKAGEVRDTSLRVSPGVFGTVVDVTVFTREGIEKDARAKNIEDTEVQRLLTDQEDEIKIIKDACFLKIKGFLLGKKSATKIFDENGKVFINKEEILGEEKISKIDPEDLTQISVADGADIEEKVEDIVKRMRDQIDLIKVVFEEKVSKIKKGDELPPGVIKIVKVFVAIKRKLSVGDKMAGRHGNKGVLSKVLPVEDMPFLDDGTPVDVVLNPLGVPSRMNVGQILEAHLGWAVKGLGERLGELVEKRGSISALKKMLKDIYSSVECAKAIDKADEETILKLANRVVKDGIHIASPVFDGATEKEIVDALEQAGLPTHGQVTLRDGNTGREFDQKVTVGVMYIMKLNHLVDDKIHARSIGPYSLVTQQPLGGKAQFGGQRLGEMEVWALEGYGAAHTLQEFLTVKSDDIQGRTRVYESIVKGETDFEIGVPESFNVLIKELQGLALNIELLGSKDYRSQNTGYKH